MDNQRARVREGGGVNDERSDWNTEAEELREFYANLPIQRLRVHGQWLSGAGIRDAWVDAIARTLARDSIDDLAVIEWLVDDAWEFERLHAEAIVRKPLWSRAMLTAVLS